MGRQLEFRSLFVDVVGGSTVRVLAPALIHPAAGVTATTTVRLRVQPQLVVHRRVVGVWRVGHAQRHLRAATNARQIAVGDDAVFAARDLQLRLHDDLVGEVRLATDLLAQLSRHVRDDVGHEVRDQNHNVLSSSEERTVIVLHKYIVTGSSKIDR